MKYFFVHILFLLIWKENHAQNYTVLKNYLNLDIDNRLEYLDSLIYHENDTTEISKYNKYVFNADLAILFIKGVFNDSVEINHIKMYFIYKFFGLSEISENQYDMIFKRLIIHNILICDSINKLRLFEVVLSFNPYYSRNRIFTFESNCLGLDIKNGLWLLFHNKEHAFSLKYWEKK